MIGLPNNSATIGLPVDIDVDLETKRLVEAWCDRRCLHALRHALKGWPRTSPSTDGWGDFLDALKNVRAFARDELTPAESATVDDLIRAAERIVYRR